MVKIFFRSDSYVITSFWIPSNLGESVLYCAIIKLRMFRGYISITEASAEAKTYVICNCTLFSDFSN